jgi:hypothetical protein
LDVDFSSNKKERKFVFGRKMDFFHVVTVMTVATVKVVTVVTVRVATVVTVVTVRVATLRVVAVVQWTMMTW